MCFLRSTYITGCIVHRSLATLATSATANLDNTLIHDLSGSIEIAMFTAASFYQRTEAILF